ncbi:dienelactone hydrolase family protein [Aquabacter spiritensis]|uniref:Carboxymethylenebutenolidase n=1 Tax=Aquabacter spiritensis TaxID=933073 RepID=A0A4R3M0K4_9HYPH|nr:dienelactone hydrolase family protein [Aquabacter spiritensis]TCT06550.1 carboxymethylenebutenolidase [Aquabacter spiritensis]
MPFEQITLTLADGRCAALLARPATPRPGHPGVILYMDAFGLRPALGAMAERLADNGYAVLVPDLYYRVADHGAFDAKTAFQVEETRVRLRALMAQTPPALTEQDGPAFIAALTEAGARGPLGAVGYCMGGGRAVVAAAAFPDRIAAAASFHGGNLATEAPDSPHLRAAAITARLYVGSAGIDAGFPPDQSARLAEALRSAEVDHIIENYAGMAHGWAVPDHRVHDRAGAARHWTRLLTLFDECL